MCDTPQATGKLSRAGRTHLASLVYEMDNSSTQLPSGVFGIAGLSFAGEFGSLLVSPKARPFCGTLTY